MMVPPFVVPPLVKIVLGAVGAAALAHWLASEVRRITNELDRLRALSAMDPAARRKLPTLRRDPISGVWQVS
jgi:hypothetical protein